MTTNLTARTSSVTSAHVDTVDARVTVLTRIGAADGYAADVAALVLASVDPARHDWTVRGAVGAAIVAWIGETDASQTVAGEDGKRVRTTFGKGVDAVAAHVRRAVSGKTEGPVTDDGSADDAGSDDDAPEDETPETPDFLALAVQAAATAVANGVAADDLLAAISAALVESMALAA